MPWDTDKNHGQIADKCKLSFESVQKALEQIPVQIKEDEDGGVLYRIEGSYMHIPSVLLM